MANRKKADETKTPKRFKVVGIPAGRNITTFAEDFEKALNDLADKGYSIRIVENGKRGATIIGELQPPPTLPSFLQMMLVPQEQPAPKGQKENAKTARVRELIATSCGAVVESKREEILKKMMQDLARSIPAAELMQIADDLARGADEHDREEQHDGDCSLSKLFRQSAVLLREYAQPQIN